MISFVFVSCSYRAFSSSSCFLVSFSRSWSQSSKAKVYLSWVFDLSRWFSFKPWRVHSYSMSVVALSRAFCYCSATLKSSRYWSSSFQAFSKSLCLFLRSCSVRERMSFWFVTPSLSFLMYSSAHPRPWRSCFSWLSSSARADCSFPLLSPSLSSLDPSSIE